MKTELTQADLVCLDAARGLDLRRSVGLRQNANMDGLRPSVEDYNEAIERQLYIGRPIIPIGSKMNFQSK